MELSFKARNSLILGGFFLVLTVAGLVYWMIIQPRSLNKIRSEIETVSTKLEEMPEVLAQVSQLSMNLANIKRRYDSRSKVVPPEENTSATYDFINRVTEPLTSLRFNVKYSGVRPNPFYGFHEFMIEEGEGNFDEIYRFIFHLENGEKLHKVGNIIFESREQDVESGKMVRNTVGFSFRLFAYFTNVSELSSSPAALALNPQEIPSNPFVPLIQTKIPTIPPDDMIDPERVEVKAVVPGKAFILYMDEMLVLEQGDRVWRGQVESILPSEGKVVFRIDDGGIVKRIEKGIEFKIKRWSK